MVNEIMRTQNKIYICKECGLSYTKMKKAGECENWCKKHKSCNLQITKYALKGGKNEEI